MLVWREGEGKRRSRLLPARPVPFHSLLFLPFCLAASSADSRDFQVVRCAR